jgi:hypothetical protein
VGTSDQAETPQLGIAGKFLGPGQITQTPTSENEIKLPSDLILVGDSFSTLSQKKGLLMIGFEMLSRRLYSQLDSGKGESPDAPEVQTRHRRQMNVVLGDAHVESGDHRRLLLDQSPQLLRRWHTDNEPHAEFFQ